MHLYYSQIIGKNDIQQIFAMEAFVKGHPDGHFLQTPSWATVKSNWQWSAMLVYRDSRIVGAVSMLIRKVIKGLSLMYVPRGPVCDRSDETLMEYILSMIQAIGQKKGASLVLIDPDEYKDRFGYRLMMNRLGFQERNTTGFGNIQAQHVFRLDLKNKSMETLFEKLPAKTRYNIRLAGRKGVTIHRYRGGEPIPAHVFDTFQKLMENTAKRDRFQCRESVYYSRVAECLKDDIVLYIASLDEEPIAATMLLCSGNKSWYLYGASSDAHRNVMPNYLLQWAMICEAKERGCTFYDFRGVPAEERDGDPLRGLYHFKKGFSGELLHFTGLFFKTIKPARGRLMLLLLKLSGILK